MTKEEKILATIRDSFDVETLRPWQKKILLDVFNAKIKVMGKTTIKELADICRIQEHCIECPFFHRKDLCSYASTYVDMGETEIYTTNRAVEKDYTL